MTSSSGSRTEVRLRSKRAAWLLLALASSYAALTLARRSPETPAPPAGFVAVPAGAYHSGLEPRPARTDAYFLAEAEVSIAEYAEFVSACAAAARDDAGFTPFCGDLERAMFADGCSGHAPHVQGRDVWTEQNAPARAGHAVSAVSALDAIAYAAYRTRRSETYVFRLPTRAEWERAARGDEGRPFAWGFPSEDRPLREPPGPRPVDGRPDLRSPFGLHHVGSSVAEWVVGEDGNTMLMGLLWDVHAGRVHLGHATPERPERRHGLAGFRLAAEPAP